MQNFFFFKIDNVYNVQNETENNKFESNTKNTFDNCSFKNKGVLRCMVNLVHKTLHRKGYIHTWES